MLLKIKTFPKLIYKLNKNYYNILLSNFILNLLPKSIKHIFLNFNTLNINLNYISNFLNFIYFLKNSFFFQFKTLIDITVIDYPFNLDKRFKIIYSFLSFDVSNRLNLIFLLKEWNFFLSITNSFKSAEWVEREVWDMFGIWFFGHKNLRRILTDYIFKGFPLKKDFPLNGYIHVYYNYISGFIVLSRIYSMQEYRVFSFKSPWLL